MSASLTYPEAIEHTVRTALGRPLPAALFLILNGVLLATVERLRSRQRAVPVAAGSVVAGLFGVVWNIAT